MSPTVDLKDADWSGAVFCATRCYACQFDECPGEPHSWGDREDFAHAWATFQEAPGFCGCTDCRPKREVPKLVVCPERTLPGLWRWSCPLCKVGTATSQSLAIDVGSRHRASQECRFRRYAK